MDKKVYDVCARYVPCKVLQLGLPNLPPPMYKYLVFDKPGILTNGKAQYS
jgi:hypothetical protein